MTTHQERNIKKERVKYADLRDSSIKKISLTR
jgi:hypothetical protein